MLRTHEMVTKRGDVSDGSSDVFIHRFVSEPRTKLFFEVVQILAVSFRNGENAVEANREHHQADDGSRMDDPVATVSDTGSRASSESKVRAPCWAPSLRRWHGGGGETVPHRRSQTWPNSRCRNPWPHKGRRRLQSIERHRTGRSKFRAA
jgi:hypothetical protein